MNNDHIISIRDLYKTFKMGEVEVPALRGVSLDIDHGEFVAVIGPSGSGKSTMFHVLGGLTGATSGTVIMHGHDLSKMSEIERASVVRRACDLRYGPEPSVFDKSWVLPDIERVD